MPMMTSQILRSLKSRCVEKKTYFFSANKKIVNYTSKATSLQKIVLQRRSLLMLARKNRISLKHSLKYTRLFYKQRFFSTQSHVTWKIP